MTTYLAFYQDDNETKLNCNFITNDLTNGLHYVKIRPALNLMAIDDAELLFNQLQNYDLNDETNLYLTYQDQNGQPTLNLDQFSLDKNSFNNQPIISLNETEQAQLINRLDKSMHQAN